jgi:hypothetical protein
MVSDDDMVRLHGYIRGVMGERLVDGSLSCRLLYGQFTLDLEEFAQLFDGRSTKGTVGPCGPRHAIDLNRQKYGAPYSLSFTDYLELFLRPGILGFHKKETLYDRIKSDANNVMYVFSRLRYDVPNLNPLQQTMKVMYTNCGGEDLLPPWFRRQYANVLHKRSCAHCFNVYVHGSDDVFCSSKCLVQEICDLTLVCHPLAQLVLEFHPIPVSNLFF